MDNITPAMREELINHLSEFVLEKRLNLLQNILNNRTRYLTVALENIYQSQNASAVLRSCDCFGIQDVHVIENSNEFNVNPRVVLGSTKWLTLHRYNEHKNNTLQAINSLKKKGYRIVATSPNTHQTTLNNFDIEKGKFALFFGTELTGLSDDVINNADEHLLIPMYGFTESLNISVSAAICIHMLTDKLRTSDIKYNISSDEARLIMHEWLRLTIKSWRSIEKRFLHKRTY
jgi:tRNA (guanosine-2'-O-)-methyltransferase